MNIEQAKAIPLSVILDKLSLTPQKSNGGEVCYFTPLRKEKTPSLWVNTKTNLWHDFGDTKWQGGDIIHFVRAYLDSQNVDHQVSDALRWLRNMTEYYPSIQSVPDPADTPTEKTIQLRSLSQVKDKGLLQYGTDRGISPHLLTKYFHQATIFNTCTNKKFRALSMKNDQKGYELRTPYFKGCIGKKYITFVRGTVPKPDSINIFEGAFDFLSVLSQQDEKPLRNDALILHSLCNLKKASAYIKNYGYKNVFTWMDNDNPGKKATIAWEEFCKTEEDLKHLPMNRLYFPFKDVNVAHKAKIVF